MSAADGKSLATQATIDLKKMNGKWVIQELSDEAKDGLSGGLYSYGSQIEQTLSSLS